MNIGTELLVILVLILLNAFFAMAEMAVVSSRRARLKQKANEGSFRYQQVLRTAEHPTRFLSTIQIAITLIGTLSGTIGGATIAEALDALFRTMPSLAPYSHWLAIGLVVVTITFLSSVFGELIPKRVALVNPEAISAFAIIPVRVISSIFLPFVALFSFVTDLFLAIVGLRDKRGPSVTEEEIQIMMQQGAEEGIFHESEKDMVQGVLGLGGQRIGSYMTHRVDMVAVDDGASAAELIDLITRYPQYSQFPVRRGGMDRIIGVVIAKQVLIEYLRKKDFRLRNLIQKPVFLPKSMESIKALELIRATPGRVAFVLDEYGGLEGMVSLSDITDAVFGVIAGQSRGQAAPAIEAQADGSWLVDGEYDATDFLEHFAIRRSLASHRFNTVAGLLLEIIGFLPQAGHAVDWEGMRLKVEAMDGRRIARIRVDKPVDG